ncbi:polygalacturonase [Vigna unguiculata]|uniref:Polygalacturonase n=1 Tax=Vigna unguiculata TaxID=3917 RepID=A0A4D6MU03_VIGUN|nr:polygalacturonase [Vigna unguiculata]
MAPNVRIKGGSGYARKITFEEIILQNAKNSIIIDQYYGIKTLSEMEDEDDAVRFEGKIVAPSMNEWVGDSFSWIQVFYVNGLTIEGDGGMIDGSGSTWWEKCRRCRRPTSLRFHSCNGLTVKSLSMSNSPGAHISVNGCDGAFFSRININSPPKSPNTDGFDIAVSKHVAISKAWQGVCGEEGPATLLIPSNKIFLVKRLNLNGPCKAPNVGIKFEGKIVAPSMNEWVGDSFSWIQVFYVNGLTIEGDGGMIDGSGSTWWEKCRRCRRPTSLRFHSCNGLTVKSLSMSNSPGAHISVNGCDGDDCIAINGGSSYINATRLFCKGGHGISIGSLGRNKSHETVEEVHVQNCSFIDTTNGARIKTWPGGSGYARKITYENIILQDVKNSIIIDQYYGIKTLSEVEEDAVRVSEVIYRGFIGTSASEKAINLNCSPSGCSNITLEHIYIASSKSIKHVYAFCKNIVNGTIGSTVPKVSCK